MQKEVKHHVRIINMKSEKYKYHVIIFFVPENINREYSVYCSYYEMHSQNMQKLLHLINDNDKN